MMAVRPALAATLLLFASSVLPAQEPSRRIQITIYGEERCPEAQGDEVVVCARQPEEERYRIPPALRQRPEEPSAGGTAWGAQVEQMENATRFTRPDSCSVVGTGGQTGCTSEMVRQWYAERRGRQR